MQKIKSYKDKKIITLAEKMIMENYPDSRIIPIFINRVDECINDEGEIVGEVEFEEIILWSRRTMVARMDEKEWKRLKRGDR